jgi:hypothetical protein
LNIS